MRYVFMRYPGGKAKAVTFSYDDGVWQDKRLAEIFDRYGMKCTFNLNCDCFHEDGFTPEQLSEFFLSKGHEIAVHGQCHRANGNLRPIEGIKDVLYCRLELEDKCGRIIRGMAYPDSGIVIQGNFVSYSQIKQYLTELDIAYARSHSGDNNSFELPEDFHNWVPSVRHRNPKFHEYVDEFINLYVSKIGNPSGRHPRLLYIWGHSYEFDNDDNWDVIITACEKLSHSDDIWFATNIEIYDYIEAYKNLKYSADGHLVYNPSVTEVWIDADGVRFCIKPGETVRIG